MIRPKRVSAGNQKFQTICEGLKKTKTKIKLLTGG
jgi:hypothetical protein